MAKAFSLASWNVEHFKDNPKRVKKVVGFLNEQNADVFALYEVEGKTVINQLFDQMPGYDFHITEGEQVQEILVGVRSNLTAFFTQRTEFKTGNTYLRPGVLLTVRVDERNFTILFLHTKSSSKPIGLGIRDDMFERAIDFKKTLDKKSPNKTSFMFLGDLNTMGMQYPFDKNINPELELKKLDSQAQKASMHRLSKNNPTWWNGPKSKIKPSDLDHVVASDSLRFKKFDGSEIDVRGWTKCNNDAEKANWIKSYSDHALLYLEVEM
ncbi:MAG: endonuclease/exonuclease/phosphatase family protein [Ignavibacteriales bacterium]|nr:endonuclease/exonuclease/phosphatase family protein [Ignavibacteriales bacterium]